MPHVLRLATLAPLAIAGCTALAPPSDSAACPALDGRYVNQADAQGERLAAVLIGDVADAVPARSVALAFDRAQQRLRVTADGLPPVDLRNGADFTCAQGALHLLRPSRGASLSAASVAPRADTFHTFRRGDDGALLSTATHRDPAAEEPAQRWSVIAAAR